MKKQLWMVAFVLLCLSVKLAAQTVRSFLQSANVDPFRLEVGYNKTTHLVFPFSIVGIDRGSTSILAQKAAGVNNILKVKADQKGFEETNLSVITSDGQLYSFLVCYSLNPIHLNIIVGDTTKQPAVGTVVHHIPFLVNDATLLHFAGAAMEARKSMFIRKKKAGISIAVEGIYVKESVLFFRLRLQNHSAINFDTDQLRLYIRDRAQHKRTSVQEREILPLHILGDLSLIKANSTKTIVVSVSKFTIPDEKHMVVEIMEEGGGRHLFLKLKNKHLLEAKPLD